MNESEKNHVIGAYDPKHAISSIFAFDKIRIQRLIEISQYGILAFFISLIFAYMITKIMPSETEKSVKKKKTYELLIYIIFDLLIYMIAIFYIRHIALIVPFMFNHKLTKDYEMGKGNDYAVGISLGTMTILIKSLPNFMLRITELTKRLYDE